MDKVQLSANITSNKVEYIRDLIGQHKVTELFDNVQLWELGAIHCEIYQAAHAGLACCDRNDY